MFYSPSPSPSPLLKSSLEFRGQHCVFSTAQGLAKTKEAKVPSLFAVLSLIEHAEHLHLTLLLSSCIRWIHLEEHWFTGPGHALELPTFKQQWPVLLELLKRASFWRSPKGAKGRNQLEKLLLFSGFAPLDLPFVDEVFCPIKRTSASIKLSVRDLLLQDAAFQRQRLTENSF